MEASDYIKACMLFKKIFGIQLNEYIDPLSFLFEKLMIDLIKFESWLQQEHKYEDGISIKEIVEKYYGKKGVILLEELL